MDMMNCSDPVSADVELQVASGHLPYCSSDDDEDVLLLWLPVFFAVQILQPGDTWGYSGEAGGGAREWALCFTSGESGATSGVG